PQVLLHCQQPQVSEMVRTVKGESLRFDILRWIGRWILPAYRFQWPQIGWWRDNQFNEYLKSFNEYGGMNSDRRWALYQLTRLVATVPGDTAECGVFQGASSYLICRSLGESASLARTHFLFDSFEGVSEPVAIDGSHWRKGDLACPLDKARANLLPFNNISWHKGWIPDRFKDVEGRTFSF